MKKKKIGEVKKMNVFWNEIKKPSYAMTDIKGLLPARGLIRRAHRRSGREEARFLTVQMKEIANAAKEDGYYIVTYFVSNKKCGQAKTTIEKSRGWKKLFKDIETNPNNCRRTYAYDIICLGRISTIDNYIVENFFKRHNQPIVYVGDIFKNNGSLDDTLKKVMKHVEAHYKSTQISKGIYGKQNFPNKTISVYDSKIQKTLVERNKK